jgi:hypothetical protein
MKSIVVGSLLLATVICRAEMREWTSAKGGSSFNGEIVNVADGLVSLKNEEGKIVTVPINRLCDADQVTIAASGINKAGSASGTVKANGDFCIDLTKAGTTLGDAWKVADADTLRKSLAMDFRVVSTKGYFTQNAGGWSISENGVGYTFSDQTGLLTVRPVGSWLSGAVGIGWWFPASNKNLIRGWKVEPTVEQVQRVPGVSYVLFNLSNTYCSYTAPHSVLTAITPSSTPDDDRDLFLEAAKAFQEAGYRVIAYMACQGPPLLKHGVGVAYDKKKIDGVWTSESMNNWKNYVYSVYDINDFENEQEMYKTAFAEIIVDEYAKRYGSLIDGWWFDNGSKTMNAPLLHEVVTRHNVNTVVTFNGSSLNCDYTLGHPTPMAKATPSDEINMHKLLLPIENSTDGYFNNHVVGHMFMPAQERWASGKIVWEVPQAADWLERCITAGGAWTWSVDTSTRPPGLRGDSMALLQAVAAEVAKENRAPSFKQDTVNGGRAELGEAYQGSLAGAATDKEGDPLTYIKASGPSWLLVASNGSLSGTPNDREELGLNRFRILVGDGKGNVDFAELEIDVRN